MAAPSISLLESSVRSGWATLDVPYINVDGAWKVIHNVWIKNGGTWKLAHKTAKTQPVYILQTGTTYTGNFYYTVPADGTRYLEITMYGNNGGGGGGNSTNGPHWACPVDIPGMNFSAEIATGGAGGTGGWSNFVLEVKPGEVYYGYFAGQGLSVEPLTQDLGSSTNIPAGTTFTGRTGGGGSIVELTDYPYADTAVRVGGGAGGGGGVLTITTNCISGSTRGYTVSATTGSTGANGAWSVINGSRIWQTISTGAGSGSGGTGGSTGTSGNGFTGTTMPYIKIIPFKSNYGTI